MGKRHASAPFTPKPTSATVLRQNSTTRCSEEWQIPSITVVVPALDAGPPAAVASDFLELVRDRLQLNLRYGKPSLFAPRSHRSSVPSAAAGAFSLLILGIFLRLKLRVLVRRSSSFSFRCICSVSLVCCRMQAEIAVGSRVWKEKTKTHPVHYIINGSSYDYFVVSEQK